MIQSKQFATYFPSYPAWYDPASFNIDAPPSLQDHYPRFTTAADDNSLVPTILGQNLERDE